MVMPKRCLPPSTLPSGKRFHPLKSAQNAPLEDPPYCVLPTAANICPTLGGFCIVTRAGLGNAKTSNDWPKQGPYEGVLLGVASPTPPQVIPLSWRGEVIPSRCSNHVCFAYLSSPAGLLTLGHSPKHNVLYPLLFTWQPHPLYNPLLSHEEPRLPNLQLCSV